MHTGVEGASGLRFLKVSWDQQFQFGINIIIPIRADWGEF